MSELKFKIGQLIKWKQKWHHMWYEAPTTYAAATDSPPLLSGSLQNSTSWDSNWSVGLILKEQNGDPNVWGLSMFGSGSVDSFANDDTPGFMVRDLKNKSNIFMELTNKNAYKVKIIK